MCKVLEPEKRRCVTGRGETRRAPKIRCPFYRRESVQTHEIVCEGMTPGPSVKLNYGNCERQRVEHMETFCQYDYTACWYYRLLIERKYGIGGADDGNGLE